MIDLKVITGKETHQLAVLKSIKHFKITTDLKAIELGDMLPESVNPSQCQ